VAAFVRYSRLDLSPDPIGDLMFNGIAQNAVRTDIRKASRPTAPIARGGGYTLRYGALITAELASSDTNSLVFPCFDSTCSSVGTTPISVNESGAKTG
jgi:outer membrane receptor for ferrienterochelin and colicins